MYGYCFTSGVSSTIRRIETIEVDYVVGVVVLRSIVHYKKD